MNHHSVDLILQGNVSLGVCVCVCLYFGGLMAREIMPSLASPEDKPLDRAIIISVSLHDSKQKIFGGSL